MLLAVDPGKNNLGFAFFDLSSSTLLRAGMFFFEFPDVSQQKDISVSVKYLRSLVRKEARKAKQGVPLKVMVIERFMLRPGKGSGKLAEHVNLVIGILLGSFPRAESYLVMPSVWKRWVIKQGELDTSNPPGYFTCDNCTRKKCTRKKPCSKFKEKRSKLHFYLKSRFKTETELAEEHVTDAVGLGWYFLEQKLGGRNGIVST